MNLSVNYKFSLFAPFSAYFCVTSWATYLRACLRIWFRRFWEPFWPISVSLVWGHIRKLILPQTKETEIGSKGPQNRQKQIRRQALSMSCEVPQKSDEKFIKNQKHLICG